MIRDRWFHPISHRQGEDFEENELLYADFDELFEAAEVCMPSCVFIN